MKKRLLSILLVLCVVSTLFPSAVLAAEQNFTITANGVLTKYTGSGGDVVIPDNVTIIGREAFRDCSALTSIHIPNSIVSIEDRAFYGCIGLENVAIPSGVTSIGPGAFYGCRKLKDVTIPNSVTSIGSDAFFYTQWSKDMGDFFIANGILFGYRKTSGGDVFIPNDVTTISSYVFSSNSNITSVTIPDSVTTINHHAFYKCSNLTTAHLSESMTELSEGIFSGCTQLSQITIPNSIAVIGKEAFRDCTNLTHVEIPEGVTAMGTSVFSGCSSLSKVTLPESLTSTGWGIFENCSSLTTAGPSRGDYTYDIQFGWTDTIPDEAFWNCASLTTITLPNSIKKIGNNAFHGTNITDVYFLGTKEEWEAISNHRELDSAIIHYDDPSINPNPKTCTVTYDLNGGTGTRPPDQTYAVGAPVTVVSYVPVKAGAKFIGWSDGASTYEAGKTFSAPNHDIVLTAQWESEAEVMYVERLTQYSLANANAEEKNAIQNAIYNLLFKAQYRPTTGPSFEGISVKFTGNKDVNETWPIQNFDCSNKTPNYYTQNFWCRCFVLQSETSNRIIGENFMGPGKINVRFLVLEVVV